MIINPANNPPPRSRKKSIHPLPELEHIIPAEFSRPLTAHRATQPDTTTVTDIARHESVRSPNRAANSPAASGGGRSSTGGTRPLDARTSPASGDLSPFDWCNSRGSVELDSIDSDVTFSRVEPSAPPSPNEDDTSGADVSYPST